MALLRVLELPTSGSSDQHDIYFFLIVSLGREPHLIVQTIEGEFHENLLRNESLLLVFLYAAGCAAP